MLKVHLLGGIYRSLLNIVLDFCVITGDDLIKKFYDILIFSEQPTVSISVLHFCIVEKERQSKNLKVFWRAVWVLQNYGGEKQSMNQVSDAEHILLK